MSDPPPYMSPCRGDIVQGRRTGTWYLVLEARGQGPLADLRLLVLQPEGSCRKRGEAIPFGVVSPTGLTFRHSAPSLLAHWETYGRLPGGSKLLDDLDPTTETISNPTTSKEDTPMNSNHITSAIDGLLREEALKAVRPTFKTMNKVVRKTKVGQALRITDPESAVFGIQVYSRVDDDRWEYGNGTQALTTERVVAILTAWAVEGKVIVRLVEEEWT